MTRRLALLWALALAVGASAAPRSPEQFLGYRAGADQKLATWSEISSYCRELGRESPRVLAEDVVLFGDNAGKRDRDTASSPLAGRRPVARFFVAKARSSGLDVQITDVNGWPALVMLREQAVVGVVVLETDGRLVFSLSSCVNPAKLRAMSQTAGLFRPGAEAQFS